jgi:phosphoglycolate phosphatase-like HAD superfamily hydrolase
LGGSPAYKAGFQAAFAQVFNLPHASQADIDTVGKIDNQIILEIAKVHGLGHDTVMQKLPQAVQAVIDYHQTHETDLTPQIAPGAVDLLNRLTELKLPLGLLTGNIEASAWLKMEKSGLKPYFSFGGFGDQAFKRVDLIDIARKRCNQVHHTQFQKSDFVIIGDLLLDIKCAKDGGIRVIAVATGKHSLAELQAAGADIVVPTLESQEQIFAFLS